MGTVKQHDFVEIEYTGMIKEDGTVFDTTDAKLAHDHDHGHDHGHEGHEHGPVVICVGQNQMLPALEQQILGKESGKEFSVELNPDESFGRRDAKMIQLISMSKFKQQKIQPFPGLQLNIDGAFGIVKTVSGGRCYVDFNHPLAGKDVVYKVKINKILNDSKEKLASLVKTLMETKDAEIEITGDNAKVYLSQKIADEVTAEFNKAAQKVIPEIKKVEFAIKEAKKPAESTKQ